jgi:dipeptidyl aminopeptidase/acylaminoacyl peptidase
VSGEPLPVNFYAPLELGWVWWGAGGTTVWFLREDRGARRLTLCRADTDTGAVHEVIVESSACYVETHPLLPWPSSVRMAPDDRTVVWPSERDGWRHLYLYDGRNGDLLRQLTSGEWVVRDVLRVDERWVWFTGLGREPGRDPYFRHLYRVALDGGEPELLTPEDADHAATLAPSGRYVLDTASTIAIPPVHRLRRSDGIHVADLATADLSGLEAEGWRRPERFVVTAADGQTQLYGALFFPSDFDPSNRYPVVDSIYPGPQLIRTPKSFTVDSTVGPDEWPGAWDAQALAELGFVTMTLDGRGTPLRSRELHLASYGRLGHHALDDHVAAIAALAGERPWMDRDRIGICGHSAGGAAAVRGVLEYPGVFKAAVAGSGVHDIRRYLAYWAEKYQGLPGTADLEEANNIDVAQRLERPVLLIHGELDDNVPPANSLALADALIRADKDVELVLIPGQNHNCAAHPYYIRRTWEFFVRHLMDSP